MNRLYPPVAERAAGGCEYCRAPEAVFNFPFDVDHIVPRSKGEDNSFDNLAQSCESCNTFKSDEVRTMDPTSGDVVPLFHPRNDIWVNHFEIELFTAQVLGLTPIGRATVELLRMNSPFQVRARARWILIGMYP